ncbi:DUF4105 domain-containing protein [Rudaea sp.]|jgi:hypothetical protein|uniref:Lnb N-terminal periplasmic domain-containing protein n=1 Tax=Rudaea sp. TaxID=2136325 RepID=UPI002F91F53F
MGKLLATLVVAGTASWGALALWFKFSAGRLPKLLAITLWMAFSLAVLIASWQGRITLSLLTFVAGFAALLLWWRQLKPSNNRLWNDEVAQMVTGTVTGSHVTLRNVRNFEWRSRNDYTQRWETRDYDLDRLRSVDMILSYWAGPVVAHTLVSFGFDDGEYVVFSVEIRRQKELQHFSQIGGFFKRYELSIVAADERDVIRVRSNVRGEDDYLYRVQMPTAQMRSLLLAYMDAANRLVETPRFYNTITGNCTTIVYQMVSHIIGGLPLSYRLLLSGYLPEYVYAIGGLDQRYPLEELRARGRIGERARQADRSATFSADIRRGIPELAPKG